MNEKVLIITGAGLIIGFAEALLFYNLGKNENRDQFKFEFPKGMELVKNVGAVIITSLATAILSNSIGSIVGNTNKKLTPSIA